MARSIHFVGSAPFPDARTALRTFGQLNDLATRFPDGEPGERGSWLLWQTRIFRQHEDFVPDRPKVDWRRPDVEITTFRVRPGRDPGAVRFGDLGYAAEASRSYAIFRELMAEGVLPPASKFQVSLPTPFCIVWFHVADVSEQVAVEPAFEDAMRREIDQIASVIPAEHLSIQWDIATEMIGLERGTIGGPGTAFPDRIRQFDDMLDSLGRTVARLCGFVPQGIDAMVHLCFGDWGHKHSIEPKDASKMVAFANTIFVHAPRRIDLIHLPVPRERYDEAFFAPLQNLRLPPATQLALGLVHHTDGLEGTLRRMRTANKFVANYAIGTDCGLGRRRPETITELLRIHREAAQAA
jgi:hypothetical protein